LIVGLIKNNKKEKDSSNNQAQNKEIILIESILFDIRNRIWLACNFPMILLAYLFQTWIFLCKLVLAPTMLAYINTLDICNRVWLAFNSPMTLAYLLQTWILLYKLIRALILRDSRVANRWNFISGLPIARLVSIDMLWQTPLWFAFLLGKKKNALPRVYVFSTINTRGYV